MSVQQKRDTNQEKGAMRKRPPARGVGQELLSLMQASDSLQLQRAGLDPAAVPPANILALQRAAGNRAVSGLVQTKLTVGAAGDYYEREADKVAEQVLSMPSMDNAWHVAGGNPQSVSRDAGTAQRQEEDEELQTMSEGLQTEPLAATITPLVQRQEEDEELMMKPAAGQPMVQRQEEDEELMMKPVAGQQVQAVQRQEEEEELQMEPVAVQQEPVAVQQEPDAVHQDGSFEAGSDLETRLAAEKGGGSPLPDEVRGYMEPRFGADFGNVRVHTGNTSTQLSRDLGARAFTHGQDIHFQDGTYDPGSSSGKRLLAHELTHTVQQGAANRVQTFMPTGHRLVTEAAFADRDIWKQYGEKEIKFLTKRAPDMDAVQDQTLSMNEGIALSEGRIKQYEAYIKAGDEESAKRMWNQNELHFRPPPYMLSHGEGGLYKQDSSAAAAINEGMTRKMLDKSVGLWNWDDDGAIGQSLGMLSDTLHQAEDRGSHQEGEQFKGHDVRLGVFQWKKKHKRELQDWETLPGAPALAIEGKWDPDNASKNKVGTVLGVAFAQGVLRAFANMVKDKPSEALDAEDKTLVSGLDKKASPRLRHLRPKKWMWFASSANSRLGKIFGKSAKGRTERGKRSAIKNILNETKSLIATGQMTQEELEKAGQTPEVGQLGDSEGKRLDEGFEFYETGAGFNEVFAEAEGKFREWRKPRIRGGFKKSKRIMEAMTYFASKVSPLKSTPVQMSQVADSILKAYEQVFKVRLYAPGQVPYVDQQ